MVQTLPRSQWSNEHHYWVWKQQNDINLRLRNATSAAAIFLAAWGPFGAVIDFPDASIAIKEASGVLDYASQGTISEAGDIIGPLSKMTYAAPSLKITEQADGYSYFQAHNLCLASENVGAAQWNASNQSTAPDAETVQANAGTNIQPWRAQQVTVVLGPQYTLTFEAKAGTHSFMQVSSSNSWGSAYQNVNLATNAFGAGNIPNAVLSTPENVGGGWYRYSITAPVPTDNTFNIRFSLQATATDTRLQAWSPVGTETIKLRKVHLRRAPSVSTYMKTTTTAAYDLPWVYRNGVKVGIYSGEASATNLWTYSSDLTNAAWSIAGVTRAAQPAGRYPSSTLLTEDTSTGTHRIYRNLVGGTGSQVYTFAWRVRRGTGSRNIFTIAQNGANLIYAWFNLGTGTVHNSGAGGTGVLAAARITAEPDGWYLLELVGSPDTASASYFNQIYLADTLSTGSTNPSYTGDGVSSTELAIPQVETGIRATTPIITYGVAGFRGADSLSGLISAIPYDVTNQTWFAEVEVASGYVSTTSDRIIGGNSTWTPLYMQSNTALGSFYSGATASKAITSVPGRNVKAVSAYSSVTGSKVTADGLTPATNANTAHTTPTSFFVGSRAGTSDFVPGIYKKIGYFNRVFSDAEMQVVSA